MRPFLAPLWIPPACLVLGALFTPWQVVALCLGAFGAVVCWVVLAGPEEPPAKPAPLATSLPGLWHQPRSKESEWRQLPDDAIALLRAQGGPTDEDWFFLVPQYHPYPMGAKAAIDVLLLLWEGEPDKDGVMLAPHVAHIRAALLAFARHSHPTVRAHAAGAIWGAGDTLFIPALEQWHQQEAHPEVKAIVAHMIQLFKPGNTL